MHAVMKPVVILAIHYSQLLRLERGIVIQETNIWGKVSLFSLEHLVKFPIDFCGCRLYAEGTIHAIKERCQSRCHIPPK